MNFILPFIVGWCGTGWPLRFRGSRGTGGFDPDFPWPDNCPPCAGFIGGVAAIVFEFLLVREMANVGFGGHLAVDFFVGSFAVSLIGGVVGLTSRSKAPMRA